MATTASTSSLSVYLLKGDILSFWDQMMVANAVLISLVAIIAIAVRGKTGFRGHFLCDRSLSFVPMACSMVMSNIGSAQFVGMAGLASRSGVTVFGYELNATIALIFLGWIFFPVYISSGSLTTIEYLKKRYGSIRLEVCMSLVSLALIILTKTSVELHAIHKLLQRLFVETEPNLVCIPILAVAIFVPFSGGLKAVVFTNSLFMLYFLVGSFPFVYHCMNTFHTYDELKENFFEAWPNTTRAHFDDNSSYRYTTCGIPMASSWHLVRAYNSLDLPWPGMFFGVTINSLWYWCCDQLIVQTGLGAKNIIHLKYACLITGYMKLLSILLLVLPGLIARILETNHVACADPEICQEVCGTRNGCSNLAFPSIFLDVVPPNYRGFILVAVMACSVSSLAASLNSGSSIFTINIYRNIRPKATELEVLCIAKAALVVLGAVSLFSSSIYHRVSGVYTYMQSLTSMLVPPVVAIFLCGLMSDRATEKSAFATLIVGLCVGGVRLMWEIMIEEVPCGDEDISRRADIVYYFHFLHFSIFLFVLSVVFMVITGIFSEPILVVHLYRLLYWLRHSKLDRVDLSEVNAVYETLLKDATKTDAMTGEVAEEIVTVNQVTQVFSRLCCMDPATVSNVISNHEIRETGKYRANIKEPTRHARALTIHVILLLVVSSVMWGYFF